MCLRSLETLIQISEELIQTSEGSSYRKARVGEVCHLESLRDDDCQKLDRQHRLGSATVILGAEFLRLHSTAEMHWRGRRENQHLGHYPLLFMFILLETCIHDAMHSSSEDL